MEKKEELSQKEKKEIKVEVKKDVKGTFLSSAHELRVEFRKQASTAIITALGLVIALSWQTLIQKVIGSFTSTNLLAKYPYLAELYTAVLVTIVAIIAILIVSKWAQGLTKKPENK